MLHSLSYLISIATSSFASINFDEASLIFVFLRSNLPTDLLSYSNISLRLLAELLPLQSRGGADEKITVSRISRAIRFRSQMRLMLYLTILCCLHAAFANTDMVDRDTIAKHFHGDGLSRRLSWDLRGLENRLRYQLGLNRAIWFLT